MHVFYFPNPFFFYLTVAPFHLVFILLMEMSLSSCVTVTQSPCNKSPSFRSGESPLLFLFEPLTTHSSYYVVWNTFFDNFSIIFSCTSPGPYNIFSLSLSGHSTLILSFESLLTDSLNYLSPIYFSLFFSVKLFRYSCVTVTQGPCNISQLVLTGHSTLLFSFELFMTLSHNYVADCWLTF